MVKPFGAYSDKECPLCGEWLPHRADEAGDRCTQCGRVSLDAGPKLLDVGRAGLWFFLAVNVLLAGLTLWRIFQP